MRQSKNIINEHMPLAEAITPYEVAVCKQAGIPCFRGILYEQMNDDFGRPILKEVSHNTVVLGGAILALEHLCNATATFKPATLNTIYSINQAVTGSNASSFISLFGVGTDGSGLEFNSVNATNIKAREVPAFIPLRSTASLTGTDAAKYFLKKLNADNTTYSYYLKEFDSTPTIKSLWKDAADTDADGTEITQEVYNSARTEGIESFAEFSIKLNVNDVREYFIANGNADMARYNTLGLFTGQKVEITTGVFDYVNVRLFSYTNFDNKPVKDKTEASYLYRVFSLV